MRIAIVLGIVGLLSHHGGCENEKSATDLDLTTASAALLEPLSQTAVIRPGIADTMPEAGDTMG